MHLTQTIIGGVAIIGALQFAVLEPIKRAFATPQRILEIAAVEYIQIEGAGHIRQHILPPAGVTIKGAWVAQIERPTSGGALRVLCSGSGIAPYSGTVAIWPLTEWASADCPTSAQIGDYFEASWTWQGEDTLLRSVGGRWVLTGEGLALVSQGVGQ